MCREESSRSVSISCIPYHGGVDGHSLFVGTVGDNDAIELVKLEVTRSEKQFVLEEQATLSEVLLVDHTIVERIMEYNAFGRLRH